VRAAAVPLTIDIPQEVFLGYFALYEFKAARLPRLAKPMADLPYQHSLGTDENVEPASKLTLESAVHSVKQPWQSHSTDDGIQIDESGEQGHNPYASIRESLQSDSHGTLEIASQQLKQRSQSSSTDDGMQIDESDANS
jgi:hypothetical protein